MTLAEWKSVFRGFVLEQTAVDAAHDLAHIQRVVQNATRFAQAEQADLNVVIPAAWLHDCVIVPKDSPQRPYASRLAADTAVQFLRQQDYPAQYLDAIAHAIAAHSFSAGIPPQTIEAKVVQDADRIDAIGAIGIARAFAVGGALQRPLYHPDDPFCRQRPPDDFAATVDHFYTKLFKLEESMQTAAARREAQKRTRFMRDYLAQLAEEIGSISKIEPIFWEDAD
ncbi:MAG TPA: HD domain-containing protein [Anaerolineae bacterium]|nr:HD domain-containing protein [Anaerolineae bacterium]